MSWSNPKSPISQKGVPQVASPPRGPASAVAAARAGKTRAEQTAHNAALYKTELCRSFSDTGYCRYGLKCQFAHGLADLRPVTRHKKYKTERCKNFIRDGSCPYGPRCRFIHSTEESPDLTGDSPSLSHIEATVGNHPSLPPSANTAVVTTMSANLRSEVEAQQQSAIFGFRNELEEEIVVDGKVVRRLPAKPHAIVTTATVPVGSPPSQSIAWQHALQIGSDRRGLPSVPPTGLRTQSRDSDSNPSLSPNGVFSPSSASSGPSLHRATSATSPQLSMNKGMVSSTAYPSGSISDAVRSVHYPPSAFDYEAAHRDRRSTPSYAAVLADDQPRPPRSSDAHYGSSSGRYYSDGRAPSGERQYSQQELEMLMSRMQLNNPNAGRSQQEYGNAFPPHISSHSQLAYEQLTRKHAAQAAAMRGGRPSSQYPMGHEHEADLRPVPSSSPPLPIQHPSRSAHYTGAGPAMYRSHSSDAYHASGPAPAHMTHSHSYPYSMTRAHHSSGSYQDRDHREHHERAPNAHSLTSLSQLGGLYSDSHSTWGSLEDSHTSPTSFAPSHRMLGGASSEEGVFSESPAVHPAHPSAVTSPLVSASPPGPRSQSQSAFAVSKQLFSSARPPLFGTAQFGSPLASASSMSPGSLSAASPLPLHPSAPVSSGPAFSHIILPPSNAQAQALPNAALTLSLSVDPNAPAAVPQRLAGLNTLTSPTSTVSGPDDSQSDTTAHSGTRLHTNRSVASLSSVGPVSVASTAPSEHSESADKEADDSPDNGLKRLPVFSQLCFEDMQQLQLQLAMGQHQQHQQPSQGQ